MSELKKGSQGQEVFAFYDYFTKYSASYSFLLGKRDGYYGADEARFVDELQRRLGVPRTGRFGDLEAARTGYKWGNAASPPSVPARRKIWFYSNPGSGANEFQGPSFQLGERCQNVLKINHQPVHSAIGGYLGFMGGDPTWSYVDVTYDQYKSLEWLLDNNPNINDPDLELWFTGYSQKADGLEDAIEILFGDGGFVIPKTGETVGPGKYRHLRSRINGIIQFGNPSTRNTGIARKIRPEWLYQLVHNINYDNDFYAVAKDKIRPPMYAIIIKAEMELPFFVHVLKIAVPVIMQTIPVFGGILGPLGPVVLAGITGLNGLTPLLGGLMGQTTGGSAGDDAVDAELIKMLSITGLISSLPDLIGLVGALPGLQAHGGYEFDPVKMDQAYNVVAGFRR